MKRLSVWFQKYFIPSHGNDNKPHILREKSALIFLSVIFLVEIVFLAQVLVVFKKTDFLSAVLPGVLMALTNTERLDNGAGELTPNALLEKAAQLKAEDMAKRGYFAHTSPDGLLPWYWLDQAGYEYSYAGENLAVNFFDSEDVADAWMKSPSHRANIVRKDFKEIGIGVARGTYEGKDTVFVVQFFGTPALASSATKKALISPQEKPAPEQTAEAPAGKPDSTKVLGEVTTSLSLGEIKNPPKESPAYSFIKRMMTSPRHVSAYLYTIITLIISFALILAYFIRIEIQHPHLLAGGMALVVVIAFFSLINTKTFKLEGRVPSNDISASVIQALP